ncbi:GDSL esterase/lipase 4-like [Quercus robur]|uniref:GDSL esterase/lipase 4-like n=1 Tax=Quercus robur TaxID=38942 RepID=UPI002161D0AC|nr:GDSL esterase/lipase 4-like [Quercus robur]
MTPEEANPCVEEVTSITKLHNKALPKALKKLESELKGLKYSIADFYTFLSERIDNPSKYGFKEGKIACCGTGPYNGIYSCGGKRADGPKYELCRNISDYVFFDAPHPSEKAYQQFAELIWSGSPNVIRPHSLKELFDH